MRGTSILLIAIGVGVGCGDDSQGDDAVRVDAPGSDAPGIDAPASRCETIPAMGQFTPRDGNPRLRAGRVFPDGKLDTAIADPDVRFAAESNRYDVYYMSGHGTAFNSPDVVQTIRRATSPDKTTWTILDEPALAAAPALDAWDHDHTETPTVAYNPAAPPDRRYLLLYSGANGTFPHTGYGFANYAIGAAFSADGVTFTRVPSAESIGGQAGLVLTGALVYPGAVGAIVADPEVAVVDGTYHLFFSSFACSGTGCATPTAYGVGHATSPDGVTWTVAEAPVRTLLRQQNVPTSGGSQPSVLYDAVHCRWELWLASDLAGDHDDQPADFNNMAGVYRAESLDGIGWNIDYSRARDLSWNAAAPRAGEALGLLTGADVAANGNGRLMLYVGFDDQSVPDGFFLPDRTPTGFRPGVMTLNIATRDLP